MKKFSALLLVFALLFTAMPIGSISAAGTQEDPLRILAIGNSYSNNATEYISDIANSMGLTVTAASLYYPGCSLKRHVSHYEAYETLTVDGDNTAYYADTNTYKYESLVIDGEYTDTNRSIQEAIAYADWDYITIQQMPDGCDDITTYWTEAEPWLTTLYDYVKTELEKNKNTDCEILIHQGWSFSHAMSIDNAYEYYPVDYNNTREFFEQIELTVNEAAEIIKTEVGLDAAPSIVPSGKAVQLAKDEFGFADTFGDSNSIYDDYISHLGPIGRYLVACVWIETFAAADTRTATYFPADVGITEDMAVALRSCAREAATGVQDTVYSDGTYSWRAVPQDGGLKITHFMGTAPENGAITIPSTLGEKAVVAVDDTTFKYVEGVNSVTFEEGADISVEDGAFDGITDIWYGQIAASYAGGQGTETDPYLIENGAQLALALNSFGKNTDGTAAHYKLTADIYLNDVSSDTWTSNNNNTWFQGKDKSTYYALNDETTYGAFVGSIDGDGHMVYGIYYPETTGSFASGLIPVFSGSYIKNLGVDKAYIISDIDTTATEGGAGAIAGITKGSLMTIDSCFSGADVTVKSKNGASGIVGSVRNGATTKLYVSNCYSLIPNDNIIVNTYTAAQSGTSFANGILGNTYMPYFSVTNSYSVAKPYCFRSATYSSQDCIDATDPDNKKASSAIIENFANVYSQSTLTTGWNANFNTYGTYTDGDGTVYQVAYKLTESEMTGANALENMDLGDKFFATDSYPALKVFYPQLEPGTVWDGSSLIAPTEGSGTENDPIEISTAAQLAYVLNAFGKDADENGLHYKLTADIYLNDVSEDTWTSNSNINTWFVGKEPTKYYTLDKSANGAFEGSIDGDGHMVYGIYYPDDTDSLASGLIPVFSGSYIKNIGVDKAYLVTSFSIENGYKGAGAIAGVTTGSTMKIDSCFSGADIKIKTNGTAASGIVGSVRNNTAATKLYITNCYSLIPAVNFDFKNGDTYYDANTSYATKAHGIIGDNYVVYFSVTNSYSVVRPYRLSSKSYTSQDCLNEAKDAASSAIIENFANVYSQNIYTSAFTTYTDENNVTHQVAYKLTAEEMQGANAFEKMTGFEDSIWYAVKNDTKSPMLRVHGTAIGDVDEDGVGLTTGDAEALRKHLIDTAQALNGNYNKDDATDIDILDLVELTLAQKKNNP